MKKIVLMFSVLLGFVLSGQNLLSNPGFEAWTAGMPDEWTKGTNSFDIYRENGIVYSGNYSVKIILKSKKTQNFGQKIQVQPNVTYYCSLYVYTPDKHTRTRIWLQWYDANDSLIRAEEGAPYSDTSIVNTWQLISADNLSPSTAKSLQYQIRIYDVSWGDSIDSSISYVDDASLRSVSGIIVPDINTDLVSTHILPYMVSKKITLSIVLKNEGAHSIDLRDISGRTIMSTRQAFKSGINLLNIDTQNLANGIYFLIFDKNLLLGKVVKFE